MLEHGTSSAVGYFTIKDVCLVEAAPPESAGFEKSDVSSTMTICKHDARSSYTVPERPEIRV
jgi:hypothetical protein